MPVQPELGDALGLAGALGLAEPEPTGLAAVPAPGDTPVPVRVTVSEWLPSRSCQWKTYGVVNVPALAGVKVTGIVSE
jgi:hypothetical protein